MGLPTIKLIAMDLDGTLLRDDKTIDNQTRQRLLDAQDRGIIIVIATGRDKGGIDFVYEPLELETRGNNYVAGVNGQIIYSFKEKEYFVDKVLNGDDAKKIMRVAKKYNCEAISCCGYDHYDLISPMLKFLKKMRNLLHGKPMDYGMNQGKRNFIEIHDAEYEITQDINKVILIQTPNFFLKNLDKIRKELPEYELLKVGSAWIEVMPKGVNKGSAILQIAKDNGIKPEEILCFGDAENDLSMMHQIPHGIAMGNAMDIVKKAAFEVCDTNMNAGIAKTLDKYIFKREE